MRVRRKVVATIWRFDLMIMLGVKLTRKSHNPQDHDRDLNNNANTNRNNKVAFFPIHRLATSRNLLFMLLLILLLFIRHSSSQLVGSERTMEQFLDRLLHESVYDRRIRPFYTDSKSNTLDFLIVNW